MTAPRHTAHDVVRALYQHFGDRWAVLTEVTARPQPLPSNLRDRLAAGEDIAEERKRHHELHRDRRIDVLLIRASGRTVVRPTEPAHAPAATPTVHEQPTLLDLPPVVETCRPDGAKDDGGIERLAIEVKVTRADFLSDVRNPAKQAPWRHLAHRHSGLIVVKPPAWSGGQPVVEWDRRAPRPAGHHPGPLPLANLMDAYHRAARAEAVIKGHAGTVGDDDPETLRATVKRLRAENDRLHRQVDRERELRQQWQRRYATHAPPACATCGQPLHIARSRHARTHQHEWEHRDETAAAMCLVLRTAHARTTYDALPKDQQWGLHVPGPEPVDSADTAAAVSIS